ncbi:MAG: spermine synthase [Spirochaetaceae bacterium]|nr:MAG: spermine synthase [Spirochaetaceae bacterium]
MKRTHATPALVLSLGIVGQIGQIVLLRELLIVFHGNELSMGIILGAWMVWVGLGSVGAGYVASRFTGDTSPAPAIALTGTILPILLPVTLFLVRILRSFFSVQPGAYLSIPDMTLSVFLVTAPVGVLLGMLFVLLARAWRLRDGLENEGGAGKTYVTEALGNALGGVLFSLLLVNRISSFHAVVLAGIVMALASLTVASRTGRIPLWIVIATLILSLPFLDTFDGWAHQQQWKYFSPEHQLLAVHQSRYGTVSVAHREGQYSFFQSGNLVFSAGEVELEEQEAITAAHLALTQHPRPRRILLVGGGLRGILREILTHPVERVDYLELDPVLTRVARQHLPRSRTEPLDRREVRLLHGDGRLFIKSGGGGADSEAELYDIIIIDTPDPFTAVLNRYYTEEFFREAARRLQERGVLVIGVGSAADLRGRALANRNATIYHTLKRVFDHVLPLGQRHLTFVAAGSAGITTADPSILQMRYLERGIRESTFSPFQFQLLLEEDPLRRLGWILRNHGRTPSAHMDGPEPVPLLVPTIPEQESMEKDLPPINEGYFINSDFRPIGYVHTLAYWSTLTRDSPGRVITWILRIRPWWIIPPILLALLTAVLLRGRDKRRDGKRSDRYAVLVAVFTTGLSTMALQIALLFAFQSFYGYVYEMIGLIVAAFMVGLALGATAARRFVPDPGSRLVLRRVQLIIAVWALLIGLALPPIATIERPMILLGFFFTLTFSAGFLNGFDFPLTTACYHRIRGNAEGTTGIVYGMELFGACLGSLLAGLAVAPVLGIVACCMLAATGNAVSHGILRISEKGSGP